MTNRGRAALLLGAVLYVAAWAFGSQPLYPVAVGLLVLNPIAWACVRLSDLPLQLHRRTRKRDHWEGDDVAVDVEVECEPRLPTASMTLAESIERLGERQTPLQRRAGHRRGARYILRGLPRGRYGFPSANALLEDPFGLNRRLVELPGAAAIVVFPRLVEVDRLFSEGGPGAHQGRRILLRRPVGYDVHGVREYEQGESLRRVHWPTTARRGRLMVKELEDSPRDEVAVVLDGAGGNAGVPPDSSFDVQVRAAGSILRTHVRRGKRASLVVNGTTLETQRVHSLEGDWRHALELLAAAEPGGQRQLASLLSDDAGAVARVRELVLVTAALSVQLADRLVQRRVSHLGVSVVWVDAASFAGREPAQGDQGIALRLQGVGVPVTVIRRGDDLATALGPVAVPAQAHA
jgi:uncharacterized protein (DUF58 family)